MKLVALTRWDYSLYDAESGEMIGRDAAASLESQPLGLLFQFTGPAAELMLALESDAEQVLYQTSAAGQPLIDRQAYFGFSSPVLPDSELGQLLGSELQAIYFGLTSHEYNKRLLFGIKLRFVAGTVLFMNQADEGAYLFEGTPHYHEYLTWYSSVFGPLTWVPQPHLLMPAP